MMKLNCYYLFPTLPTLKAFDTRGMTLDKFLDRCTTQLSDDDANLLKNVTLDNYSAFPPNPTFKKWQHFEIELRNQLTILRARKLGLNPDQFLRSNKKHLHFSPKVQELFDQQSPVKTEKMLFELRWSYLNRMDSAFYFSLDNLIIYYLKLQLLEQWSRFNREQGKEVLDHELRIGRNELQQRLNDG